MSVALIKKPSYWSWRRGENRINLSTQDFYHFTGESLLLALIN